jgi:trehalose 6-phosphate synthase/phosphatase
MSRSHRPGLIVVSNRLPVVLSREADDRFSAQAGCGGLVTALLPVLRHRGGVWVGWPGVTGEVKNLDGLLAAATREAGYRLHPVSLTVEEQEKFYYGFSNEVIWPLFHDFQSLCNFEPDYWRVYSAANHRYAEVVSRISSEEDFIWVHDYQLMNVAQEMRACGSRARIAFFLHIPFPPLDIYANLPWRFQVLRALLEYDLIGFQTLRDRRNFVQCLKTLVGGVTVRGRGQVQVARVGGREVRIGVFPIGIDFGAWARQAHGADITGKVAELRSLLPNRQLLLGIDRLDYTKGIPHRLQAFRHALARYPELHERVTLIQVVVPSREHIPRYNELKTRIERLVTEINGEYTRPGGWVPIHHVFRGVSSVDLLTYYRAADIALVTPLKDGMNLVAKEYCACSIEKDCVLILSEFAGAAAQLQHGALLVNPNDLEGTSDAIYRAFQMGSCERRARMRRLRRVIRHQDVFWWVDSFLRAAIAKDISAFPVIEDYVPSEALAGVSL